MASEYIYIHSLDGKVLLSVLITEEALFHEELMTSDYVMLSWNSDSGMALPLGSYIIYNGEKYSLLEEYNPERTDEYEYRFSPQFHSRIMGWQKQPVPLYTYGEDGITVTGREFDWEFTGSPTDAMYMVQQAIKNETGETWSVQLADSLPATISVSSQSDSIFSLLSQIADACKTEWWVDKSTNTLFLSFCQHGSPVSLSVGVNIKAPSVTSGNKEYFTRFYAFGSTRNITQDNEGGQATNHIVNKRLTLDPAKYPGGYKDVKGHFDNGVFVSDLKPGEIFSTTVYLDDIYPKSKLTISDVRARLKYRLDSGTGDKVQVGTDDDGSPIYEQYAIWYFKIANFSFDLNSIIEGENLSVSFETGQLAGRDFELSYHEKAETVKDGADVTEFEVEAGDYEIILDETSGITIPGLAYIIPQDGDQIVLYNIKMPNEYVASAREELETAIDKEISTRTSDNNSYEFDSDPVSFNDDSMDVMVGQSVNFSNIGTLLQTRVLMVEKHLDYPCQQRIRVGNERIKGNTQQLKEDVTNASQNIDLLKAFNNLSQSLTNAYANAQREMIEGFASIKNMWRFDPDDPSTIYSEFNAYVKGAFSALGKSTETGGGGSFDLLQDWAEYTDEKATWALSAYLGYGLYQDVQSLKGGAALTVEKTGGGNVVTGISKSGTKLTVAKGITALTSVSLATISDLNSSWDALLKAAPAVFVTRWPSISEVTGKQNLVLKLNGGTTEGTSQFTYNGTSAKSVNITTANIGADAKFVTALGTSGNYLTWTKNGTTNNITVPYATNADMLDGTHKSGLLTALTSSASTNLSLTVGGTAKSVADLYATYSERLLNARTLWGQSFDGTANVSGNMSEVGSINFAENGAISIDAYGNIILNNNSASWSISKDSNYAICVRNSSLNVGIGTNNPLYKLHVVGTGYFSGQLTAQSFKLGSGTISWDSDNNCFRFSHGLYSDEFVSALGLSGTTGGGGGDYNRLDDWGDYDTSKATWALSAKLGYELYEDVTSLKNGSALNFTTTGSGNVVSAITKSGTTVTVNKGITALTSHQPIYALTIQGNGTTIGTFNPKSAAATINITPANIGAPTKTGGGASGTWGISISGNAATASKWQTARTLTLTGAVTGSASIDGSGNVSLATTYSTGNISALDSRYVNVSGDTMTGTLTLPASGMFTNSHFRFGNDKGRMGADSSGNLGIYGAGYVVIRPSSATEASSYGLTITSSSLEYNGGKVWHAGNDGSGSGLDADTLDGRHYTSFPLRIGGYLYASSGNPSVKLLTFTRGGDKGWLRISISDCNNGGSGITALYVVKWPYSSSSDASTYPVSISCLYSTVVNVSDRLTVVRTSGATFDLYYTPNSYGSEVGCVLEGYGGTCTINNYDNSTAPTPTPTYTSSQGALFTNISGSLSGNASTATKLQTARQINGTNFDGSANITTAKWGTARTIYIRDASQAHTGTAVSVDGSANEYLLLPSTIAAALDGNATSATKLQTARTLWGQSFNGTANVSGDMTGVGAISMSGLLTANGGILVPSSKTLKIGSGTISWDTANNMFHFSHGLYSDGAVSALGVGSASGGGGGGSVDILQDWAQYDAGTAKSTALSAYLGYEMRQELQSTVGNIGNTPDYVCTLDLSDIDLDFRRLQQAVLGTRPMFYIVTDNSVGNYVVGTMCMFSDNSYHVLTQVLTTHFLVQDGVFSAHVDSKVYTYYRSYNFGAPGLEGPTRQWTEWREAYGLTGEGSFMGVATPSTAAPSLAYGEEAYYVAATAGTYANLGGLTVASGEVALIRAAYSPGDPSTSFSKTTLSKAGGAVTIASITDLHSSWDSVLKAQKPSWLTSVSIATISDLNSGWDALLKAAPAAATSSKMGFMSASDKDVVNRLTTLLHDHAIMYSSPELTGYWGNASYGEIYIPVFGYYDGAWNESTTTIRLPRVSTSNIGLMTADDKKRLDALIDAITGTGKGFVNGVLSIDKTATSISLNYDLFRYTGSDFENGGYGIALPSATTSLAGLMSAADKAKLDSISSGGLESVSIADITDLHSSWDALLKAAPSSHITRWPTFSEVSSKPTTLSGYGITDGVNAVSVGGSGNAVTAASISGHTLTLTKGSTFLLSSAYTAADVLSKLKTVDGSGSGLDADTLDGVHESSLVRMTGRNTIYTSDQAPYAYIHLFRVANSSKYSTLRIDVDVKTRYHAAILHIDIQTNQYPYGDGGSSITIHKQTCNGRSGRFYYKRTVQSSGYNYYDIYYQCGTWNGGSYGIISEGSNGTLVYEPKGTNIAALPDGCTELSETSYPGNASTATKLQTARQINGTNFDGSTNITTAKWGTARTIKIGNTGKSVNGSANVTWTLAEIGSASISEAVGASDAVPEGMTITRAASSFGLTLKTIAGGDLDELSLPMATTSLAGLMSASDKSKLNSALTSVSLATISDLNSSWDALLKAAPAAATASTMGFMSASDKAKMTEFSNALYNLETMGLLKNDGNGYLERLSSVTQSTNSITINFVAQHLTSAGVPQSGYSIVTLPAASTTKAGLMSATDFVLLQGLSHAASSGGGNGILHAPLTTSRTSTSVSINYTVSQYDGSAFKEVDFNLPIPSATTSLPGLMSASDKTTIGYLYGGGGGVSWSTISGWFVNNTSATVNAQKIMKVDSYFDLYAIRIEDTEHQVYHITEGTDAGPLIAVCGSYQTTRGDYIAMFTVVLPNTTRRPYATRYVINY